MDRSAPRHSLLDELDGRQNEVIKELEELSNRIERIVQEWNDDRTGPATDQN